MFWYLPAISRTRDGLLFAFQRCFPVPHTEEYFFNAPLGTWGSPYVGYPSTKADRRSGPTRFHVRICVRSNVSWWSRLRERNLVSSVLQGIWYLLVSIEDIQNWEGVSSSSEFSRSPPSRGVMWATAAPLYQEVQRFQDEPTAIHILSNATDFSSGPRTTGVTWGHNLLNWTHFGAAKALKAWAVSSCWLSIPNLDICEVVWDSKTIWNHLKPSRGIQKNGRLMILGNLCFSKHHYIKVIFEDETQWICFLMRTEGTAWSPISGWEVPFQFQLSSTSSWSDWNI